MGKKKKVRDQFEEIFQSGDEKKIKNMLEKYPWLLEEVSEDLDKDMLEQHQIIAALGVMEDELGNAVPIDEIVFSLRVDFSVQKSEDRVQELLTQIESLGLVKKKLNGWALTSEGGKICDDYLNKTLGKIEL